MNGLCAPSRSRRKARVCCLLSHVWPLRSDYALRPRRALHSCFSPVFFVMSDILDPSALIPALQKLLPAASQKLNSPQDGLVALVHAAPMTVQNNDLLGYHVGGGVVGLIVLVLDVLVWSMPQPSMP